MNKALGLFRSAWEKIGHRGLLLVVTVTLLAWSAGFAQQDTRRSPEQLGHDLTKRILKAQETSGFQMRVRMILGAATDDISRAAILQVRILGQQDRGVRRLLFQVLWPTSWKGYTVVLEQAMDAACTGFLFKPPEHVTPLTPILMKTSFAGSGLAIEDLAENHWRWPMQQVTGQGQVGKQSCTLLESRPGRDEMTSYSMVRGCIDPQKAIPLWIEKFGKDGTRLKRITFHDPERGKRREDFRASIVVEDIASSVTTQVEILKSERNSKIAPEEFTLERLKRSAISLK